jgi:hypothetical protein
MSGQGGGNQIAPSTPVAAGATGTPATQQAQQNAATQNQGYSEYLKYVDPAMSVASKLFGGGGQGQQPARAPTGRPGGGGQGAPALQISPAVPTVPIMNAAPPTGGNYSPINMPNFSQINPSNLTPQQMQLAMLLQGRR